MICARCSLVLAAGSRHPVAADCVDALRFENDRLNMKLAAPCAKCGGPTGCLKCGVKREAKKLVHGELDKRAPGLVQGLRMLNEILKPEDEGTS